MNSDQTPLQLPWLARQAGLSDVRAKALWLEASGHAARQCGNSASSEFSRLAMERLQVLMNAESSRLNALSPARAWARLQRQYWSLQLTWLEAGNTINARTLRALSRKPKTCIC
ncbi:MAG TPA: hypothetical protein VGK09_01980 [Rhodocyclaceae bacterium]|jgi:hypothetical protein